MSYKEKLQEKEYIERGAYHRRNSMLLFHPCSLLYRFAQRQLPDNLKGIRCLDFGGGDAAFGSIMADLGADVSVFDPSKRALRYAQKADKRLSLFRGRTKLPFADGVFRVVVMLEVLEHISNSEEMMALREAKRVLDPTKGSLVISVPSINLPVPERHYRHYSWEGLVKRLKLVDLGVEEAIFYKQPFVDLNNWLIRKTARGLAYGIDWLKRDVLGLKGLVECNSPEEADGLVILAKK